MGEPGPVAPWHRLDRCVRERGLDRSGVPRGLPVTLPAEPPGQGLWRLLGVPGRNCPETAHERVSTGEVREVERCSLESDSLFFEPALDSTPVQPGNAAQRKSGEGCGLHPEQGGPGRRRHRTHRDQGRHPRRAVVATTRATSPPKLAPTSTWRPAGSAAASAAPSSESEPSSGQSVVQTGACWLSASSVLNVSPLPSIPGSRTKPQGPLRRGPRRRRSSVTGRAGGGRRAPPSGPVRRGPPRRSLPHGSGASSRGLRPGWTRRRPSPR